MTYKNKKMFPARDRDKSNSRDVADTGELRQHEAGEVVLGAVVAGQLRKQSSVGEGTSGRIGRLGGGAGDAGAGAGGGGGGQGGAKGQVQGDVVLVATHDAQQLQLETDEGRGVRQRGHLGGHLRTDQLFIFTTYSINFLIYLLLL